jgi:hypothetical protein
MLEIVQFKEYPEACKQMLAELSKQFDGKRSGSIRRARIACVEFFHATAIRVKGITRLHKLTRRNAPAERPLGGGD